MAGSILLKKYRNDLSDITGTINKFTENFKELTSHQISA